MGELTDTEQQTLNPAEYRPMIDPRQVEAVLGLVVHSGIGSALDCEAARVNVPKGPGGRKRAITTTAAVAVMLLLAVLRRPLHLKAAAEAVCLDLDDETRRLLGIRYQGAGDIRAATEAFRSCLHRAIIPTECSNEPYNKVRSLDDYRASRRDRPEPEIDAHREFVTTQMNALVHQTLSLLPDRVADSIPGDLCVDATFVETFAHGVSNDSGKVASDPDGSWYVRRNHGRPKYGYDVHIGVIADLGKGTHQGYPTLSVGFTVDRCGSSPGGNGRKLAAGVADRLGKAGLFAGDRAYNNSVPEVLQTPLALLGYQPVWDYKTEDLGVQSVAHGAIQVEGTWYCPAMPKALVNASIDLSENRIDKDAYVKLIAERRRWSIRVKDGPTPSGSWRGACPAASSPGAPRVCCANKPRSDIGVSIRPRVSKPPKRPDAICSQQAVTFGVTDGAKHAQALPYKSPEWEHAYGVLRNSIESTNAYLKDAAFDGFEHAHRHRVRGIGFRIFFAGILITAANMHRIAQFLAAAEVVGDAELGVKRRVRTRHRHHDDRTSTGAGADAAA